MRHIIPALFMILIMESCANKMLTQSNTNEVYSFADESARPTSGTDANYVYNKGGDSSSSNETRPKYNPSSGMTYYTNNNPYSQGCNCPGNYGYYGSGLNNWGYQGMGYGYYSGFGYHYGDPFYNHYYNPYYNPFSFNYGYPGFHIGTGNIGMGGSGFNWFSYYGGNKHQPVQPGIKRVRGMENSGTPGTAGNSTAGGTSRGAVQNPPMVTPQPQYNQVTEPSGFSTPASVGFFPNQAIPSNGLGNQVTQPISTYQPVPDITPMNGSVPTFNNTQPDWNTSSPAYNYNSGRPQSNPAPVSPSGWPSNPPNQGAPQRNFSQPAPAPVYNAPTYSPPTRTYTSPAPTYGGSGSGAPTRMSRPR